MKEEYYKYVALVGIVLFLASSTLWLSEKASRNKKETEFKGNIEKLEFDLKTALESMENYRSENASLTEKVLSHEQNIESLEDKNKRLDREREELEKIVETDPELLKKYSKVYFLNENYTPKRLVKVDSQFVYPKGKEVEFLRDANRFLEDMLEDAVDDDVELLVTSGYRSFDEQKSIKSGYKVIYGAGTANQFSAEQGYSEHQIGTAVDFVTGENSYALSESFEKTDAFKWLEENAYKYGFILSYPRGNTYYSYEPWHWRFVGRDLARSLHRKGQNFYDLDQREIDKYLGEIFE